MLPIADILGKIYFILRMSLALYIYIYMGKYGNMSVLECKRMILFIELFANDRRFGFLDPHQGVAATKWNEKEEKVVNILFPSVAPYFKPLQCN